jgi:hypothetical protein
MPSLDLSTLNFLAVLVAAVGAWITGAIWYAVLGKQWMAALGKNSAGFKPSVVPMVISFVGDVVMAAVLAIAINIYTGGQESIEAGLVSAVLLWIGFVLTTITVNNAYAGRPALLTAIDAGHWLAAALVAGAIIGAFG